MLTADELSALPDFFVYLAAAVFILGGVICVANFWLFLQWAVPSLRKPTPVPQRPVSALPIIGSLLVFLMLRTFGSVPAVMVLGVVLIMIDAGGIHWGLLGLPYVAYQRWCARRAARRAADDATAGPNAS